MSGVVRGDAFHIPLRSGSVDLVVTSPPFFGQRVYTDGGERYDGQIGVEPTPQDFLEALWTVMREVWRVLKDDGVAFVNLGDKRSGSGAPGTTSGLGGKPQGDRTGMTSQINGRPEQREQRGVRTAAYTKAAFGRPKSKQLIPHRFAIGCADGLADPDGIGWIVRHDLVWDKPNGLPESVRDRPRDSHEYWFMLTKQGDYFSAMDEIRVPHKFPLTASEMATRLKGEKNSIRHGANEGSARGGHPLSDEACADVTGSNPLGKLPGSVWEIATEPLVVPKYLGVDHFAAFPIEWPRRLILGFAPNGICTVCGQARTPIVDKQLEVDHYQRRSSSGRRDLDEPDGNERGMNGAHANGRTVATITGYSCDCADDSAPTTPAVVLDPFGGTGTTAMVARALGHTGVSLDLSADYCRLARWRIYESGHGAKIESRTNADRQGTLL